MPGQGLIENGTEKQSKKKVFYTGTDALKAGYLLCYERDSTTGGAVTTAQLDRATRVEKPSSDNIKWLAGFVTQAWPASATGRHLEIVELDGHVIEMYTDASCTINSTALYAKAGSYAVGANGQVRVGTALQTVDRSDTNGVVPAVSIIPNTLGAYDAEGNSTTFSDTIWLNMPVAELRRNPSLGTFTEYDPIGSPVAAFPQYAAFGSTGCTSAIATDPVLAEAGQIRLIHDGTDNDGIAVQFPGAVVSTGGKPWAWEAVVDLVSVTNTHQNALVGLVAATTLTATSPIAADGTTADVSSIVFRQFEADGDALGVQYTATGVAVNNHDAATSVPVANTAFKVGMYYNGTDITVYYNGTSTADPILAADIAAVGLDFPLATTMYLTVGTVAAASVGASDGINIRAFRVAQLA